MAFNWDRKLVSNKGDVVSSYRTTGTITVVTFEDGKSRSMWTANGDVWRADSAQAGKDYFLVEVAPTDKELADAYRKSDAECIRLFRELQARGIKVEDDEGDVVDDIYEIGRIYKTEEVEL